jgi:acyl-CoA dehydrogenase
MSATTLIEESLATLLSRQLPPSDLRAAVREAGMPEVLALGESFADAAAVARLAGMRPMDAPIAEGIVAAWLLRQSSLACGASSLSLAIARPGDVDIRRAGDAVMLEGKFADVAWGKGVEALVAVLPDAEGCLVAVVEGCKASAVRQTLAGDELATIVLRGAVVPPAAMARAPSAISPARVSAVMAFLRAAQILGAAESCFRLSVDFVAERRQFGRPIGDFQAVQHMISTLACSLATVRVAVNRAAAALDRQAGLLEAAFAKSQASELAARIAADAHQIHGAIGFTQEYSLGEATRRLWSWRDDYGSETYWNRVIGMASSRWNDGLWARLVDGDGATDAHVLAAMEGLDRP